MTFALTIVYERCHDPYKPTLILIQHYYSFSKAVVTREVTQEFVHTHVSDDLKNLQMFFEGIHCM